jgi:hypothetical protein
MVCRADKPMAHGFYRLRRCYERREEAIDAFLDLADAIIIRCLIWQVWILNR